MPETDNRSREGRLLDKYNDAIGALVDIANDETASVADLRTIAREALVKIGLGHVVKNAD
jgi:hypothetical protein